MRPAMQNCADDAQDGHLKRFGVLTPFLAQEPKSNEVINFRYVQRDADVPEPLPTTLLRIRSATAEEEWARIGPGSPSLFSSPMEV